MGKFLRRRSRKNPQAGLTMIELMVAAAVVVFGFTGALALVLTAIASNNRNRMDSTGTMLAQAVVEDISSVLVGTGSDTLVDCTGGPGWQVDTTLGGASLNGSQIDFTQTLPSTDHHHMNFVVCNVGSQATYDVRWNISQVTSNTFLVTVGVKPKNSNINGNKFFAFPLNLRTYVSN